MLIIVEDDIIDFMLLAEAAKSLGVIGQLLHRTTAADTLSLLRDLESKGGCPEDLALLVDLNLQTESGFDVIERITSEDPFSALDVHVWSCSNADSDRDRAAALGVKSYFVKSTRQADNVALMRRLLIKAPAYQRPQERVRDAEQVI